MNITGSLNDASVFNASGFGQELEAGRYPLPEPKSLPGINHRISHFFIGDEAFGLRSYLMRPYPKRYLKDEAHQSFNYRYVLYELVTKNFFNILKLNLLQFVSCSNDN